jgi:cation diffusion facilitator CzcD-associated flavoprotein CzcO
VRIAVIGAGAGGICVTKELLDAGFDDVVVLERNPGVGGTWLINRYPGCECDVQSALYSFSWSPKPDWSKPYGTQPEILDYLRGLAGTHGVLSHCRFGVTVTGATWEPDSARWRITTSSGDEFEAEVLVAAVGMFREPSLPDIVGIDTFAGTMFHSARWDGDHDLSGERVAVIGSAASAVQLAPPVAKVAGQLHLFQRTANWVLPKIDDPYSEEELAHQREHPEVQAAFRAQIYEHMDAGMTFSDPGPLAEREAAGLDAIAVVEDPTVRAALVPDHPFGCKRPLFSNNYYPTFNRPDVELVTDPIDRIVPEGVVTADGTLREVDTIVLATGFSTTRYVSSIGVTGRDGRRLDEEWADGARAYLGITTPGFPNLFMLYGPNTNNGSILTMLEAQSAHVVAQVRRLRDEGLAWVDVRPGAAARYDDEVQRGIAGVAVWLAACGGYYRSPSGRVVTQWPFSMTNYRNRTEVIDRDAFECAPLVDVLPSVS